MTAKNKATQQFRVALLSTSPSDARGSMTGYADLVATVLLEEEIGVDLEVTRINLAGPVAGLKHLPGVMRNWIHHVQAALSARTVLSRCSADIFHILDGSHAYIARYLAGVRTVATVHDIIPYLQVIGRLDGARPSCQGQWLIKNSIKWLGTVNHIVADSNNTKRDLCRVAGIKDSTVSVVPLAVSGQAVRDQAQSGSRPWSARVSAPDGFMLHVGNDAFYKNRAAVIRIFAHVRKTCRFVGLKMAGAAPQAELVALARALGVSDRVEFITHPSDAGLSELYQQAALLVFPSIYEGFGWPPLEAMAHGCPVVCSDAASLPEVVGDAALTASPDDETRMAEHCVAVLADQGTGERLVQRGYDQVGKFSVDRMCKGLMDVYMKVAAG